MYIHYDLHPDVLAFTAGKGCRGTEPGVDARQTGVTMESLHIPADRIFIPRQTHSVNVCHADAPGEVPDTDAVITRTPGLCVAVKTADCIPILLHDPRQGLVAAVHAGWRGTVGHIVSRTLQEMQSRGADVLAVIGPGISLDSFEVGDEVYDAFREAGFPMQRLARRYPARQTTPGGFTAEKWHIDLWEANRWLLQEAGVTRIQVSGSCTFRREDFYSARRETIHTGRNISGILLRQPDR